MSTKEKTAEKQSAKSASPEVAVHIPVLPFQEGAFVSRHVDLHLTEEQAAALKYVTRGLDQGDCRLKNGKHVSTKQDAIRWMLEQVVGELKKL